MNQHRETPVLFLLNWCLTVNTQDKKCGLTHRTSQFLYWVLNGYTSQILNYHREHPCSYTRFQVDTQDKSKHDVTENIPFRMFYIECAREDEHMNSATLQKLSNSSYGFASPTLNITINMHHKSKTQQPTSPGLVAAVFLETPNPSA